MDALSVDLKFRCLCLDLETSVESTPRIHQIGIYRSDTSACVSIQGRFSAAEVRTQLDRLSVNADCLLGHHISGHDLPILQAYAPGLAVYNFPVIDTLWLSPLAFPQNPYHRLVKDYKLVKDSRNDPVKDAQLCYRLFGDQLEAFRAVQRDQPDEVLGYHYLLAADGNGAYDTLFARIRGQSAPSLESTRRALVLLCQISVPLRQSAI